MVLVTSRLIHGAPKFRRPCQIRPRLLEPDRRRKELLPNMPTTLEGAEHSASSTESVLEGQNSNDLLKFITNSLDDAKALDVISIDLTGKSSIGDFMVVASGRSERHVGAVADRVMRDLKEAGLGWPRVEGLPNCDWVLIDTGDIVVHVFRPEVRDFYKLEKMWSTERPVSQDEPARPEVTGSQDRDE